TAFSLPLLLFYNNLWNNCDTGALPFMTAHTRFVKLGSQRLNVPGKTGARNMHQPFSAAVDMYRRLEEILNALATLGRYAKLRYTAIEPLARRYRRYAALRHATALLAAKDAIFAARRAVAQRKRHSFVPSLAQVTGIALTLR
ncbi:hypothetical protein PCASD_21014, partial [Puccinia coronata f. sp. avenae]